MAAPLAERLNWILKTRKTNPGALSEAAGLSRSHIRSMLEKFAEGRDPNPMVGTLHKIAKAADVRLEWLMSGQEPREPYAPPQEAEAPPPSARRIAPASLGLPELAALFNEAQVQGRHSLGDALAVEKSVSAGRLILPSKDDPEAVGLVRVWLDAAARLRARDIEATPDRLVMEITHHVLDLENQRAAG
jgi:transcriptional regulator with XRE-family HTH domain